MTWRTTSARPSHTGECAAFYVVYGDRVVLFCAPGVAATGKPTVPGSGESSGSSKSGSGFALVTNSLGKVRGALDDADVPYEAIGEDPANMKNKNGGLAAGNNVEGHAGVSDGRSRGGAYGHGIPLEVGQHE